MTLNLFESPSSVESRREPLAPGAVVLRGFAASDETTLFAALQDVIAKAPFRHMITPHLEENLRYATTRQKRCLSHQDLSSAFPDPESRIVEGMQAGQRKSP